VARAAVKAAVATAVARAAVKAAVATAVARAAVKAAVAMEAIPQLKGRFAHRLFQR
jgi:hypothetical protein